MCGVYTFLAIKFLVAIGLIMSGAMCGPYRHTCSDSVSGGLIGSGIGIIFSGCLSTLLIYSLDQIQDRTRIDIFRIRIFFGIKIAIALILLIPGCVCLSVAHACIIPNSLGGGLIGASVGIVISSIFSATLVGLCVMRHGICR